jgi:hypothetical protein
MEARNQQTSSTGKRRLWRRPSSASLVSVAVHAVLLVLVWNAVQMPAVFDRFLQFDRDAKPSAERVQFVTVVPSSAVATPGPVTRRPTSTSAPTTPRPVSVPLVAPTEVPTQLPPPAAAAETPIPGAATGPLRGGNGPTRGVQPNYDDPRVWPGDPEFIYAPKTDKERLDSALVITLRRHVDSLAVSAYSPNKFERGDWTFERNGQKYGIDQQYIRLGRFQIPTALLALLPLNRMQGNPIAMERDRNAAYMRADILLHAQAAMNEEEFRKAVRAIRDRKERERRQKTSPTSPGPLNSPGERPPQ